MHRLSLILVLALSACVLDSAHAVNKSENNINWYYYPEWLGRSVVMLLTFDRHVWRSPDAGFTWSDITASLPNALTAGSQPAFLYPNPVNSSYIYVRGSGDTCWVSRDHGATWTANTVTRSYRNIEFHPRRPDLGLAGVGINFPSVPGSLYLTRDFGASWNLVSANITQFGWGDAGKGSVSDDRIYAIRTNSTGNQNFEYSDDFGLTWIVEMYQAYQFVFRAHQIFAVVYLPIAEEVVLRVSVGVGSDVRRYYEAEFPFGDDLYAAGYAILDDATGSVFMGVNHGGSVWGNLYTSDYYGARYVLAQEAVGQQYPVYDFMRAEGLDGIYMANIVDNPDTDTEQEALKSTVYTYDNGAEWNLLIPPARDNNNQPFNCQGVCKLNLHGWTSFDNQFGPFYSVKSAVGIAIANGNVGPYLSHDPTDNYIMISRDAGLTWNAIYQGPAIYEIGDHGALIVLAPIGAPTNMIYYTTTEGTTPLIPFQFSDSQIYVHNIVIETSFTGTSFILLGWRLNNTPVLFGLNFTGVWSRKCGQSDYEKWSPSDGRPALHNNQSCVLGRETVYKRRLPTADCFNPEGHEVVLNTTNCTCTKADFECDFYYSRNANDLCELEKGANLTYPPDHCPPGGVYYKTSGYRLEPGNTCSGTFAEYVGTGPFDCPGSDNEGSGSGSKGWIAFVVAIPVTLILVVIGFFALRSEWVQKRLPVVRAFASKSTGYLFLGKHGEDNRLVDDDEHAIGTLEEEPSPHSLEDEDTTTLHSHTPLPSNTLSSINSGADTPNLISIDEKPSSFDEFDPRA